ncbi:hypothetical protein [Halegenticoccus tardaugens]|uniref:hypothetical protein n=1 Tax=Halegenticoccus tardaugens TaxID=2071624 RepID=UPI00100A2400|nr:hypothetical protein [Halegenticoccus tardaugens]
MSEEIVIPDEIIIKIEERIEKTDFMTVEDYINYVLTEAVYAAERAKNDNDQSIEHADIKDRLKTLGYLN